MVKEKYDVEIHSTHEVFCNPAPLSIVYTTRSFNLLKKHSTKLYKFVGPSISSRIKQDNFDLVDIKGKSPIYISLGTVFNRSLDFYKLCFEAFGNSQSHVVMSVGQQTPLIELGEIPKNFIVKKYVPQTEVLKYTKLFITHGGMNSTNGGSLLWSSANCTSRKARMQPIIAGQVANIGAGIKLQMRKLDCKSTA